MEARETCVIALGGNAILPVEGSGTIEEQRALTRDTMAQVAELRRRGMRVVLTHGNGPIVGNIALRNEALAPQIPPMPLDVCGADSQGGIGYMIQQALRNELHRRRLPDEVVTVITQVEVDADDPAFTHPTKPIGPFYTPIEAATLRARKGWTMVEDAGRGMRRVVPSPRPRHIVEIDTIRRLVDEEIVVNCVGGGGVPVLRGEGGDWVGVEAVIDKDHTAALLARQLHATRIVLLTGVETVMQGFGTPEARPLRGLSRAQATALLESGEFPAGSMGPKIRAGLDFLKAGGHEVVITDPQHLASALANATGTHIVA